MKTKQVGDRIAWHVEGAYDEIEKGEVAVILEWPFTGGVRAYGVKPDNRHIVYCIVKVDSVVEEAEND